MALLPAERGGGLEIAADGESPDGAANAPTDNIISAEDLGVLRSVCADVASLAEQFASTLPARMLSQSFGAPVLKLWGAELLSPRQLAICPAGGTTPSSSALTLRCQRLLFGVQGQCQMPADSEREAPGIVRRRAGTRSSIGMYEMMLRKLAYCGLLTVRVRSEVAH